MIKQSPLKALLVAAAMAVPSTSIAQQGRHGNGNQPPAPKEAFVHFGIFPTGPLGPAPCALGTETPPIAIGGPADPCAYKLHVLTPEEALVREGGEVTFQIHGGGHGMAIYRVDKDTERDEVGQYLCAGDDPADFHAPTDTHPCPTVGAANAAAKHRVRDGDGDVVIVAAAAPPPTVPPTPAVHPDNRVWYVPGRLMSAGGIQFLTSGGDVTGQLVTYQFLKKGRYLVICINRSHFLNDWMFGFVNVTDDDHH